MQVRMRAISPALAVRLIALLCLGVATLVYGGSTGRYRAVETQLVENLDWSGHVKGWAGSGYGVRLDQRDYPTMVLWRDAEQPRLPFIVRGLPMPDAHTHLVVSALVRVRDVATSGNPWERASLHIEHFDDRRRRLSYWPYRLAALDGESDWQRVQMVLPIAPEAAWLRFVAFIGGKQGHLEISQLRIHAAEETAVSLAVGVLLRAGWAVVIVACIWPLLRRLGVTRWRIATGAVTLAIVFGSLTPQPYQGHMLTFARDAVVIATFHTMNTVRDVLSPPPEPAVESASGPRSEPGRTPDRDLAENPDEGSSPQGRSQEGASGQGSTRDNRNVATERSVRLVSGALNELYGIGPAGAHYLAYLLLAAVALPAYRRWPAVSVLLGVGAIAFATECLQVFIITRESELSDFLLNLAGIATGGILAYGVMQLRGLKRPAADASGR